MQIYLVQPGDSVYEIANTFGSSVNDIVQANELETPESIVVGQAIVIPIVGHFYFVKSGDSLYTIGQKFNLSIEEGAYQFTFQIANTSSVDPTYLISGNFVQKRNPKVDLQYDADKNHATIDVIVPFDFEIFAITSMVSYSDSAELKAKLKRALEENYTTLAEQLIAKTQQIYRSDPFYWSLYIRKYFKDVPSFEKADWTGHIYPNADITIEFQLERLEFGKSIYDTNLKEMSD